MCTAIAFRSEGTYFGRTLDFDCSYGSEIVITPRGYCPPRPGERPTAYAVIGMARAEDGYPLYFDGMNERGLCIAGLRFAESAAYRRQSDVPAGCEGIPSYALPLRLLGRCADLRAAKEILRRAVITDEAFSPAFPPSPMHWLLADGSGSLAIEQTADGLHLWNDPVDVLTNEPPLPEQLRRLADFRHLTPETPQNTLAPQADLPVYSRGMGTNGLPGGLSSPDRFVRAAFSVQHSVCPPDEESCVSQFFHTLGTVEQIRGCCVVDGDRCEITQYTSCCSAKTGIYYYTTYQNRQIAAVDMHRAPQDGGLVRIRPIEKEQILRQN